MLLLLLSACLEQPSQEHATAPDMGTPAVTIFGDDGRFSLESGRVSSRSPSAGLHLQLDTGGAWLRTDGGEELGIQADLATASELRLADCPPGAGVGCVQSAVLDRGPVAEWWVATDEGFQQGFRVDQPTDTVRIPLRVTGATATPFGADTAMLTLPSGGVHRYTGLVAFDADGRSLDAHMEVEDSVITLVADARGARFPVTVDPVVTSDWTNSYTGEHADVKGDFNGDGYADVVVLDQYRDKSASYTKDTGAAYVYYGSEAGPSDWYDWSYIPSSSGSKMGNALAIGDINDDGYDDMVVGNSGYNSYTGRVYVFLGSSSGFGTSPNQTFSGPSTYDRFGSSLGIGDFDGDGYDDVMMGSSVSGQHARIYFGYSSGLSSSGYWDYDDSSQPSAVGGDFDDDGDEDLVLGLPYTTSYGQSYEGALLLFLNTGTTPGSSADWDWDSDQTSAYCGKSLAVGDYNGDGIDDLAAGCQYWDEDNTDDGRVVVFYGSSSGFGTVPDVSMTGDSTDFEFGTNISTAGDMDGDGDDELFVGSPEWSSSKGRLDLFLGSTAGLSTEAHATIKGTSDIDEVGTAVGGGGDINGDGLSDLVATNAEPKYGSSDYDNEGVTWAFYGSGLADLRTRSIQDTAVTSSTSGYGYGHTIGCDVDGDGYNDALIGSNYYGLLQLVPGADDGLDISAAANVFYSSYGDTEHIVCAGDINGDFYDDVAVFRENGGSSSSSAASTVEVYYGSSSGLSTTSRDTLSDGTSRYFGTAIVGDVDIDDDGYKDLVIGDYGHKDSFTDEGRVLWYAGSSSGITAGTEVAVGGEDSSYLGSALSTAGDVNGDGYDDIFIVAKGYDGSGTNYDQGFIGLYLGSSAGLATTATWSVEGGAVDAELSYAIGGGDINADGYPDAIIDNSADDEIDIYLGDGSSFPSSASATLEGYTATADGAAFLGDQNDDGGDELMVADPTAQSSAGVAWRFLSDGTDLESTPDWMLSGGWENAKFGQSLSTGDVNGDGYDDWAIGSPGEGRVDVWIAQGIDEDGDGYGVLVDCDDADAAIYPDAPEACDGVDNNCSGTLDDDAPTWFSDSDADGYGDSASSTTACTAPTGYVGNEDDCDDSDSAISPAATEACDSVDNDCDGDTDESGSTGETTWYRDYDSDGYGSATFKESACTAPSGYISDNTDCDDNNSSTHPGADEHCDSDDNDCDGTVDEAGSPVQSAYYPDSDGDGYGDESSVTYSCTAVSGYDTTGGDCDDTDASVSPAATEACDSVDNDCDGDTDESGATGEATWYQDDDGDGYGQDSATTLACDLPSGYAAKGSDCDDTDSAISPAATEACDSVDNDCDGDTDESGSTGEATWYQDDDGDGYGQDAATTLACDLPSGYAADGGDCDDTDTSISPDGTEVCGGADEDCDGDIDEAGADGEQTYYADTDADGWGDPDAEVLDCTLPSGAVENADDCDDTDASISPDGTEICGGGDENCNGETDEPGAKGPIWYRDVDRDGWGDESDTVMSCTEPSGYVELVGDCDDSRSGTHPDSTEVCGGDDEDCDGSIDEPGAEGEQTFYTDGDGDGYGSERDPLVACDAPDGFVANAEDCDDTDAGISPAAEEVAEDGIDQDCDGEDASDDDSTSNDSGDPGTDTDTDDKDGGKGGCATAPAGGAGRLALVLALALIWRRRTR